MGLDQMDIEINGLEEAARGLMEEPLPEDIPERETLRSAVGVPWQEPFLMGLEEVERSTEIGGEAEGQRMDDIERPVLEEIPVLGDGTPAFEWGRTPSSGRTPGETPGNEDLLTTALGGYFFYILMSFLSSRTKSCMTCPSLRNQLEESCTLFLISSISLLPFS